MATRAVEQVVCTVTAGPRRLSLYAVRMAPDLQGHAGGGELLVGEEGDRLDAAGQVAPELVGVPGPREPAGQADDGDLEPGELARGDVSVIRQRFDSLTF